MRYAVCRHCFRYIREYAPDCWELAVRPWNDFCSADEKNLLYMQMHEPLDSTVK